MMKKVLKSCYRVFYSLIVKVFPQYRILNHYRYLHGSFPNLLNPKTFNEKIVKAMLFDRNEQLTLFADKYLVREYVSNVLGGAEHLTKVYAVTNNIEKFDFSELPNECVMKANHLSGSGVKIIKDLVKENKHELICLANSWLKQNHYEKYYEWAYKNIKPCIFFEEILKYDGDIADDFKIFCFNGEPKFMQVDKGRFSGHHRNFYDMNLNLLPFKIEGKVDNFNEQLNIINFDQMIEIAKKLSAGTKFLRVDLYNINGRIIFGELTNYPSAGFAKYDPVEWDLKIGNYIN